MLRPRAAAIDQSGQFPKDLFHKAGELGLAGVSVPPEYGGAGMDVVSYAIVIEEVSRVCANMGVILSGEQFARVRPDRKVGQRGTEEDVPRPARPG